MSIATFKEYVKNNTRVEIYSETQDEEKRVATCSGFINISHGLNMQKIIIEKDLDKVNHTEKIIKAILKKEWKQYEKELEQNIFYDRNRDEPYDATWVFTKKKFIKDKK